MNLLGQRQQQRVRGMGSAEPEAHQKGLLPPEDRMDWQVVVGHMDWGSGSFARRMDFRRRMEMGLGPLLQEELRMDWMLD